MPTCDRTYIAASMDCFAWAWPMAPPATPALPATACSKFEREVRRRKLKLDDQKQLVESAALRTWAEKHRFRAYIPTELLAAWRLPVPKARVPDIALD